MERTMVILLLLGLVGCATTAERAAQLERDVAELIQVYGPACEKLGYQSNSDPWRDCILRLNATETFETRMTRYPPGFRHRGYWY